MERATRYSKKREVILEAICSTDIHPTADWVYQTLKPQHPELSLGTVYRNIAFFRELGMIQCVGVVKGQERFDGETKPHTHFVCDDCGAVLDLHKIPADPGLDAAVSRQYGLEVDRHELVFHGTCADCKTKKSVQ
ncbi:MAG: transcriptional repressor [Pseudoflavonifractor sp.]